MLPGLAALVLACPLAPAAATGSALEVEVGAIVALLDERVTIGEDLAAERLRALGQAAGQPVVELLLGQGPDGGIGHDEQRFLLELLDDLTTPALLEDLRLRGLDSPDLDRGMRLIEMLGATESPRALGPLVEVFEALPDGARQQGVALRRLRGSLLQLLQVDLQLCDTLGHLAGDPDASPGLTRGALEALGDLGRMDAVPALERILRDRPGWASRALVSLSRLRPLESGAQADRAIELALGRVRDDDPEVRRAAVEAVGELGGFEQLAALVEGLEDADSRVRGAARGALARRSGVALEKSPADWRRWIEQESLWLEQRLPQLREALAHAGAPEASAALRELASHPWHRASVAGLLLEAADREELDLPRHACALLGQLAGPIAVEGLVELLRDGRDPVRDAAHLALRTAAGADLPLDYFAWREHVSGRR